MNHNPLILVEDDPDLRQAICVTLRMGGIEFEAFECAEDALPHIQPDRQQLLITDFKLPGMNGLELMAKAQSQSQQVCVVVMTAFADAELAVQALKGGAKDFLIKPFMPQQLLEVIRRHQTPESAQVATQAPAIIAADPATLAALTRCERVAATDTTVLLTGESGVGKDVFAKRLHALSSRQGKAYVAINCAAIPHQLLESTLFGYDKGAFTGATKSQPGKFEMANEGTLFLDEIGEMPMELQAKLLRVLQDQVIERLGSVRSVHCNVRIVAATNQDLQQRVREGRFREDLYFRLAVFPIKIPPLRQRHADILPLAKNFIQRYSVNIGRPPLALSSEAENALMNYTWPGNIRELENAMQRALLMCDGPQITPQDIEIDATAILESTTLNPTDSKLGTKIASGNSSEFQLTGQDIESVERAHILKVLAQVDGNRKEAVAILGLSERALRYKLKAYKLADPDLA